MFQNLSNGFTMNPISDYNIYNDDVIVTYTFEKYISDVLKADAYLNNCPAMDRMYRMQSLRENFYSNVISKTPRICSIIVTNIDKSTPGVDYTAISALDYSLNNHFMDPMFVSMLLSYLKNMNNIEMTRVVGAYAASVIENYYEKASKKTTTVETVEEDKKKGKKGETETKVETIEVAVDPKDIDASKVEHLVNAVQILLGEVINAVKVKFVNISHSHAMATAATLALNTKLVQRIYEADLPVTAKIFELVDKNIYSTVIKDILSIKKEDVMKTTSNQEAFLISVRDWVYETLNMLSPIECFQLIVYAYGTPKIKDISDRFIDLRDCSTKYATLKNVVSDMITSKI